MENATLSIGIRFIEINPKTVENKVSYIWSKPKLGNVTCYFPRKFNKNEFTESRIWHAETIKKLVFLSICAWGSLSQNKVLASIGLHNPSQSVLSSVSSNLDAGRRQGLYEKAGLNKQSEFSLAPEYMKSKQIKLIGFVPSEQAVLSAKKRARIYAELIKSKTAV